MESPDRLRFLIDIIIAALSEVGDDAVDGDALAKRAYLSRFHFDRLVARGLGEAPATFRRRLLLERAAWQLLQGADVTRAALDNGYGSSEAFTHAFVRAYGVAPSRFAAEPQTHRLAAPNGIHFHAPAGLHFPGQQRRDTMDLTDRLLEQDSWVTQRLLDCAATLSDAQLDQEIFPHNVVDRIDGPETSVRALLDHHVFAKEVWNAAIGGTQFPQPSEDKALATLRTRHSTSSKRFNDLVRHLRERGEWDDAFVDALCDPPQSFTYGSVVAHVLVHAAHRRGLIAAGLTLLGAHDVPTTCAIEWERTLAER